MDTDSTSAFRDPGRPSSSPSEDLFGQLYARAGALTGSDWLSAMLEVEAALAGACVGAGLIPAPAGQAIIEACDIHRLDVGTIALEAGEHATPVIPMVRLLRAQVREEWEAYVHLGATSQDIIDTAAMLLVRRELDGLLDDGRAVVDACAALAREHRVTVMSGRTLLQQALPTSFGLRAAGWLVGVRESCARLQAVAEREVAVQMGGPVGSRAPEVAVGVARELGLAEPVLPWHTIRVRVGTAAGALGVLAGVLGKIARDVTLLAQNEVGEVSEGSGGGASSAMGHKHNPVAAVSVLACSRRVPGLVGTLLAAMEQEHERAAGAWQAEWGTLSDLLTLTRSAASWSRELLEHLQVHPERMRENLDRLAAAGIDEAHDPESHLGGAGELIDRALGGENG